MNLKSFTAALICSACFSAVAQGTGGQQRLVLKALDLDGDGSLSAAELASAPQALLKLDRNSDGQLTPDELSPRPENAGATADELVTQLMAFDKNGDGSLTADELPARMQNLFTRGDTDHNGKLTTDEIRALARRQGMPSGGTEGMRRMSAMMKNDPLLNALDTNHDGVISAEEITAATPSLLTLDTNHDGLIEPDEMRPRQQTPEERVNHMLDEWDTNKDGKIAKAEAPDRMQQQFDTLDKNGDGFLDRDELLNYFKTVGAGQRGGAPREGAPRPDGGTIQPAPQPQSRPQTKEQM